MAVTSQSHWISLLSYMLLTQVDFRWTVIEHHMIQRASLPTHGNVLLADITCTVVGAVCLWRILRVSSSFITGIFSITHISLKIYQIHCLLTISAFYFLLCVIYCFILQKDEWENINDAFKVFCWIRTLVHKNVKVPLLKRCFKWVLWTWQKYLVISYIHRWLWIPFNTLPC